jgi:dephospho-CoA kinase
MDRQMPQADKIARADFRISTDHGIEAARDQVRAKCLTNCVHKSRAADSIRKPNAP